MIERRRPYIDSLDEASIELLLRAPNYRSFMSLLIKERQKRKRFGYADISRYGGFSARSFPRDVILGKKRLTPLSIPKMIRGLGITMDLADYFRLLVETEEECCRPKNLPTQKLNQLRESLKSRIISRFRLPNMVFEKKFDLPTIPPVFASLGGMQTGASINEIIQRTSLTEFEVLEALSAMLAEDLATKRAGRYFPSCVQSNFQGLRGEGFKRYFEKSAERAILKTKMSIDTGDLLSLASPVLILKADLPILKHELRSLLLKFIDSVENENGDKVANLVVGLY